MKKWFILLFLAMFFNAYGSIFYEAQYGTAQSLQEEFERSGVSVDAVHNGWTALMFAAQGNNVGTITYLLSKGADINFKVEKSGVTPLMVAASQHKLEACNLLLENGAEIDEPDIYGATALHYSVANSKTAQNSHTIVEALLAKGADPNFETAKGFVALHFAVVFYNEKSIDALIKAGADIDQYGASVMLTAINEAPPEAITHLLKTHNFKLPKDIDKCLNTIYKRMKKEGIDKWTDFFTQNNIALDLKRVMWIAIDKNDIERVKKLLPTFSQVNFSEDNGMTRYNFLSSYLIGRENSNIDLDVVRLFTDAGCHIFYPEYRREIGPGGEWAGYWTDQTSEGLNFPIGIAIRNNNFALVDVLLQANKYCFDTDIEHFKSYLSSAAEKCQDIKTKNKIKKIYRIVKNIDPAKLEKQQFTLDADKLYAKARSIDPDCKDPIADALETSFDMGKAYAAAMAQVSAMYGGGNSVADNNYIQALILYDCAAALGHKEALKRANLIRGNSQLFYSDIQNARTAAINMLKEAKKDDRISYLAQVAPLPKTDTKKAEILKKVFITNYSSSKSVYDAFKHALPEDFKVFSWKNAKGTTIYEISGKTSNRYPFNGQMCPVDKFKPVVVIFVDRENGIPEMAAFKLFVDVPF
ncbi:MAG: ankyrin repeat domain-containing protein, partial [Lentisphaeria bacterium]|nr:ankyrin repeat domain-containing protein [Lentisphaeria bacterium]